MFTLPPKVMLALASITTFFWSGALRAEDISSPDGDVTVSFEVREGKAFYAARFHGKPVLDWSELGMEFRDRPALVDDFTLTDVEHVSRNFQWEQPWGERRLVRDAFNGASFALKTVSGESLAIEFRVYDDGFGFRYHIPGKAGQPYVISNERTQFHFAENFQAWSIPAYREKFSEYEYSRSALSAISTAQTPLTLKGDGFVMAIHEAALMNFASMNLRMVEDNTRTLKADLSPWSNGDLVRASGPISSPWRTVMLAETPAELTDATIILNLNEPNELGDVSWAQPQKYIGIFWAMHTGRLTWEPGPSLGATTARALEYIDWAADHGIDGVLIEGWNVGWDVPQWWVNGKSRFVFDKAQPAFDMAKVSAHAAARGVNIIGHHETGAQVKDYLRQLPSALDYYQRYGVHAIKLGYVGTRLDETEWPDGQYAVENFHIAARAAAAHQMAVFPHEPIKPTGVRRTLPNIMSREGARGQEYNGGSPDGGNAVDHTTILPFTRVLGGPLDYTPGVFGFDYREKRPNNRVPSTLANQLALFVVLYSPVQMAVDLPSNYDRYPNAFQFIRDVPVDWETSRTLAGEIGEYIVVARQDRNSQDWYLGAITNNEARNLELALDFLPQGKFEATIYADGADADWRKNPEAFAISRQIVTHDQLLSMRLASGGGQAIRFRRLDE